MQKLFISIYIFLFRT